MAEVLCTNCGNKVGEGKDICPTCGATVTFSAIFNTDVAGEEIEIDPSLYSGQENDEDLFAAYLRELETEEIPAEQPQQEQTTLSTVNESKNKKLSVIRTVILIVVMFLLGFLTCFTIRFGDIPTSEEKMALDALDQIQLSLGSDKSIVVYDAYVKTTLSSREIILFTGVKHGVGRVESVVYRVLYEDNGEGPKVYEPFKQSIYDALKNSENEADHVRASVYKKQGEDLDKAITEIRAEDPNWIRVNENLINFQRNAWVGIFYVG